jgi:hypothetical protein
MTVHQFIENLRHLILEHPHAADLPICVSPHGKDHRQQIEQMHLNLHETALVIESEGHQK